MDNEVLIGGIEKREIVIADYDPRWPDQFRKHSAIISQALGDKALGIEHVGSTSVPGLAAKPVIDIDVLVADSSDEAAYLPALVQAGYVLRVREPDWHQHRMFRTPELDVHLHIFSPGCPEVTRHLAFRDRLRTCPEDRLLYESVKRKLAREDWTDMNAYARAKSEVVEQILARVLPGAGDVPIIREARTEDASGLAQLLGELGYPATAEEVQQRIAAHLLPGTRIFLAESVGRPVGLASFHCIPLIHEDGWLGRITSLVVAESQRGRGLGRRLVAAAEEFAWASGCQRVEVTSGDHRPEAHRFYEHLGYQLDCRRFIRRRPNSLL
jgi:GrpB-like predicted nucleotidyltransferase (UPF0157 family)/GNAT superfamily N-acetyltransferase